MPNFWVTDVKTAKVTLRNPTPLSIACRPYLLIGTTYWGGDLLTIPGGGQATASIGVSMSTQGVGTHTVQVAVYDEADVNVLLAAPTESISIYALAIELVSVTWV